MAALTTHEAFRYLTTQRNIAGQLGLNANTWKVMRQRFRRGDLGTDTMHKMLERAGFGVEQQQTWVLKQ